ncbi:MAG: hypothetical protein R2685_02610 [Candidatus Nitrosocosmicus sp.]|nr:hypothetical protein [Candidatus Nitrosocosmicus sp.]
MDSLHLSCDNLFKNTLYSKYFLSAIFLLSIFSIVYLFNILYLPVAVAHTTQQFGNITLEVGWLDEPPLVDDLNSIVVIVNKQGTPTNSSSESSLIPVRNALSQMNIMIKYGGITKQLNFVPSIETAGGYESNVIPTRIGSYSLVLNGTIQNQNISAEIPVEDIEGKQRLTFPTVEDSASASASGGQNGVQSNSGSGDAIIGSDLRAILSGLDSNIRTNADNMSLLLNNSLQLQKSIDTQSGYLDTLYMVGITSIGISIGAILISAFALRKRTLKK